MHRIVFGSAVGVFSLLIGLLATGCGSSTSLPSAPSDLATREADCRAAAAAFDVEDSVYVLDIVAYAGALWTAETPILLIDDAYTELGPEVTLNQRSCDGTMLNTWPLSRGDLTLQQPSLIPAGGAMMVVGTEVLTGDFVVGDVAVWAFDIETSELIDQRPLNLPDTARFSTLLAADVRDGIMTVAVRHMTPEQERLAVVEIADPFGEEPSTSLASYRIDEDADVEIASLAMTDGGPSLWWQTPWPIWDRYFAREGGDAVLLEDGLLMFISSSGDQDWMTFGSTLEDLNTGATMVLPDGASGLMATTEGPVLIITTPADEPSQLQRYDLNLNLTETISVPTLPIDLVDLGEGAGLVRYSEWRDGVVYHENYKPLSGGGGQ